MIASFMKSLARSSKICTNTSCCQLHRVDQRTISTRDKDIHHCVVCLGSKMVSCKRSDTRMKPFGMILNFCFRNLFIESLTMLEPFWASWLWPGDNNGRATESNDTELMVMPSLKFSIFYQKVTKGGFISLCQATMFTSVVIHFSNMNEHGANNWWLLLTLTMLPLLESMKSSKSTHML